MSREIISRHYTRLLTLWPKDPLRPISFHSVLQHKLAIASQNDASDLRKTATSTSSEASSSKFQAEYTSQQETKLETSVKELPALDEKSEMVNINALYSLLEDRYSQRYPLSENYLKPKSNPEHYTALMAELEKAPEQTWWDGFTGKWKALIRFN